VSRETLVQTGAITEQVDADAGRQRAIRLTWIGIAVVVLALGGLGGYSFMTRGKADKYLERALGLAKGEAKLTPEQAAGGQSAGGEYYRRSGQPDAAQKANEAFGQARGALSKATSLERDAMLADLALVQLDLGGEKAEAGKGQALEWGEAVGAVRQTLEQIHAPEARLEAVRQVIRKLVAKGQVRAAQSLAGRLGGTATASGDKPGQAVSDSSELVAVAALELLQAKQQKEGLALAESIVTAA